MFMKRCPEITSGFSKSAVFINYCGALYGSVVWLFYTKSHCAPIIEFLLSPGNMIKLFRYSGVSACCLPFLTAMQYSELDKIFHRDGFGL